MKPWVIGNWKQNPATVNEVNALIDDLLQGAHSESYTNTQLMVIPSLLHSAMVGERLKSSTIHLAVQDVSSHSSTTGAYTGDCSALQAKDIGANWALVGHSERRQYHQEDNEMLLQKVDKALSQQLGVIFCIGETEGQYESGATLSVLTEQLDVIKQIIERYKDSDLSERLIIAYEPVWAIGTGKVPAIKEVVATHAAIKDIVRSFNSSAVDPIVLYGGSVNADNAEQFAQADGVDGALVGGASLKADSFLAIAQAFERLS